MILFSVSKKSVKKPVVEGTQKSCEHAQDVHAATYPNQFSYVIENSTGEKTEGANSGKK